MVVTIHPISRWFLMHPIEKKDTFHHFPTTYYQSGSCLLYNIDKATPPKTNQEKQLWSETSKSWSSCFGSSAGPWNWTGIPHLSVIFERTYEFQNHHVWDVTCYISRAYALILQLWFWEWYEPWRPSTHWRDGCISEFTPPPHKIP